MQEIYKMNKEDKKLRVINHFNRFGLSKREGEIVFEILEGKRNKEIADKLYITEKTVKFHLSSIYRKVGVDGRRKLFAEIWNIKLSIAENQAKHLSLIHI